MLFQNYLIPETYVLQTRVQTYGLTGLTGNTTYYFAIYEYSTTGICHLLTELSGSATTTCTAPTTQASAFNSSAITSSSMTVGWTRGNGTGGVLVVARSGSAVNLDPTDGTTYTANAAFGSGTQIGTGNYVVYKGTGTSVNVTGLSGATTYYFAIYEYSTALCHHFTELTGNAATCAPPTAPTTTGASRCGTGSVTLTASGAGGGEDYKWYSALTGGTLLQTGGATYNTPSIAATTTYYVVKYNTSTLCESTPRTAVVATIINIPSCAGISSPSNGATNQCYNTTTLNWTAASGSPTGYKLYFGTDNTPTNIINGTNLGVVLTYNPGVLSANTTYYWKIIPTNACGDASACSVWSFTTGNTPCYCTSNGNMTYNTGVTLVNFNTINNSTAKPAAYNNYTAQTTTVQTGSSYNLTVNVNTDGNYTIYAYVWIDWNQDMDFADAGETYNMGTATNTANGPTNLSPLNINVPGGAATGNTRMRVAAKYNAAPTSCETNFDGEVEDYTLNVVSCSAPSTQANIVTFSSVQCTQMTINFSGGNGSKRIVKINTINSFSSPADGTDPTANTIYGGGEQVVYNNSGGSVSVTNLSLGTMYWFRVWEYNCTGTNTKYITIVSGTNPNSQATTGTPALQANTLTFTPGCTQIQSNWSNGDGSNRLVFMKAGSSGSAVPVDGTTYTANTTFGSGSQIGTSGWYCVYNSTSTTVTVTGLSLNTTYRVHVIENNCSGSNIRYLTATNGTNPLDISTNNIPDGAGTISGSDGVCINQNGVSYSVGAIPGATSYIWNYSGGGFTNTSGNVNPISADFSGAATSGNLTVKGNNACGDGSFSPVFNITVSSYPPPPVNAGEDQFICTNPATMAASGGGNWTILNGTGTITTPSDPATSVNVTNPNSKVTFRWININGCGSSYDDVIIRRQ